MFFTLWEKIKPAIEAYEEAIRVKPDDPEPYDLRGDVYLRIRDYGKALKSYDEALRIDPESSEYLKDRGLALYGLEKYEDADSSLDKAISTNPNNAEAKKYKGSILFQLQKYEEAIKFFDEAIRLDPTYDEAAKERESAIKKKEQEEEKGREYGGRRAIVVGINRYESDSDIQTLGGAENDAIEIRERLQKRGAFEIPKRHFLIGRDATKKNILKAFSDIFRKDASHDVVAIYFAGHGVVDKNNVGYLAPYDMDPEDPFVSGINMEELRKIIYESKNQASVLMLLDCSSSGISSKGIK